MRRTPEIDFFADYSVADPPVNLGLGCLEKPISQREMTSKGNQRERPANISDIAAAAGVSPATVSRVLNEVPTVHPELRDRVIRAVDSVGYRRNRLARNLRMQKLDMIGVVVSDIENPHFSEAVRVIEDRAYQKGFRVLLCNTDETPKKQATYLEMLADERVRGAIVAPADETGAGIQVLTELDIPVVAFDRRVGDMSVDSVISDGKAGLTELTNHFISLGHHRIVYVGGRSHVETGSSRLAGYREAMAAAGLQTTVLDGEFRAATAERVLDELLASQSDATALVVANNLMTIGVLRSLRRSGVRVPEDIAIGAVDDPIWAELLDPPLTTLSQPVRTMAETAMEMVLERIYGNRSASRHEVFPMEFHTRASSGAVRRDLAP